MCSMELLGTWNITLLRAGLHHGLWSRTMEDGIFSMVQLPWSDFKRIRIYKVFGPLIRCKLNVNQKEWPGTKKWMCWFLFFFQYMTLMVVTLVFHNTPIKPKARVDVNKWSVEGDQSSVEIISMSCTPLMFEVGFYFRSLTTIKPIIKEAPIYLGHRCPIVKFI